MKSRPIIFSSEMVRAILAGQKTQTRRVMKVQPPENWMSGDVAAITNGKLWAFSNTGWAGGKRGAWPDGDGIKCPYGVVGDQLWVRETYDPIYPQDPTYNNGEPIEYDYAADYRHGSRLGDALGIKKKWKSPMFMPRTASRILLEITSIRVEQVRSISRGDCMAEGCPFPNMQTNDPIGWYADLWESINGKKHPWSDNPWVWVIEFKQIKDESK